MKKAARKTDSSAVDLKGLKAVEGYLAKVPLPARGTLRKMRAMILAAAPSGSTERLAWGMPSVCQGGALVCYAAFKNHCSLFPMSTGVLKAFLPRLKKFETSKGTIRFAVDRPLPAGLVKGIVRARVKERGEKGKRAKK